MNSEKAEKSKVVSGQICSFMRQQKTEMKKQSEEEQEKEILEKLKDQHTEELRYTVE